MGSFYTHTDQPIWALIIGRSDTDPILGFLSWSATVASQMRQFPKELLFLRVYATVASQMRHLPIFPSS